MTGVITINDNTDRCALRSEFHKRFFINRKKMYTKAGSHKPKSVVSYRVNEWSR